MNLIFIDNNSNLPAKGQVTVSTLGKLLLSKGVADTYDVVPEQKWLVGVDSIEGVSAGKVALYFVKAEQAGLPHRAFVAQKYKGGGALITITSALKRLGISYPCKCQHERYTYRPKYQNEFFEGFKLIFDGGKGV